jgi:ketosteroid isomerase-like protein
MRGGTLSVGAGVVALTIAACGGQSSGSTDVAKVKQTVVRELAALANGDGATACSLATASGRAKVQSAIAGASCEEVVKRFAQQVPQRVKDGMLTAKVKHVTIKGDTATVANADITSSRGTLAGFLQPGSAPTMLTKQADGSWKLSG